MGRSLFGIAFRWSVVCLLAIASINTIGQGTNAASAASLPGRSQLTGRSLVENFSFSSSAAADVAVVTRSVGASARPSSLSSSSFSSKAVSVEPKQSTSNLNEIGSGSTKQVAKSTPPPSTIKWIKRFNPHDGSTTTINPLLVTLPGGVVQTTEKEVFQDPPTTTETPTTTTTRRTTTTFVPFTTSTTRATTTRPSTTTQRTTSTTYRPFTTTPYHPIVISTTTPSSRPARVASPQNFSGTAPAANKPFNIFDFYLNNFNGNSSPTTAKPFTFQNRFQAQPKPIVPAVKPLQQQQPHQSFVQHQKPVATTTAAPPQITSHSLLSQQAKTQSSPTASLSLQSLEKNVAPPPSGNHQKVILHPKINIQLESSGHKFINRFVVDEDEIRGDSPITSKSNLDKQVIAPPVNNIKPILSPKISVHVGESGHSFINRFVLNEEEKSGKNKSPGRWLKQVVVETPKPKSEAVTKSTHFTSRFEVDDVNKKLFQLADDNPSKARPPQSQIFFNNRFNEGVNNFHYQNQGVISANRAAFGRSLGKQTPLFDKLKSQLPSFDYYKKLSSQ